MYPATAPAQAHTRPLSSIRPVTVSGSGRSTQAKAPTPISETVAATVATSRAAEIGDIRPGENALAQIHAGERHHDDEQQNAEQNPRKREVMEDVGLAEEELGLRQVHKIENDRIDDAVDDAVTDDALIQ